MNKPSLARIDKAPVMQVTKLLQCQLPELLSGTVTDGSIASDDIHTWLWRGGPSWSRTFPETLSNLLS